MRGAHQDDSALGKGRPKGAKNKVSADVRPLAQTYTEEALFKLVTLMRGERGKDGDGAVRGAVRAAGAASGRALWDF
jgi:hypothetical protein